MLDELDRGMDRGMDRQGAEPSRVAPVRELFRHVGEFEGFHRALARARMLEVIYRTGTNQLGRTIERRIASRCSATGERVPTPVVAQALAGALFALLRWWVDHDRPYSAEQMDEMYHAIAGAWQGPPASTKVAPLAPRGERRRNEP
jgi:hypothetical protein